MKKIVYFIVFSLLVGQCARQIAPTGGPKDQEGPQLIYSSPEKNTVFFNGKTIRLVFNEEIKLNNPREEIISNPPLGQKTKYMAHRKEIIITPELAYQDSTTYNLVFREAIQDVTESNPTEGLHLAFSTGALIDSLIVSGEIKIPLEDRTDLSGMTVALFSSDTFNIFKHKPSYFTETNKKGEFIITNLKDQDYFIYGFEDKNKNLIVDSPGEIFDFSAQAISLRENKLYNDLQLFNADIRKPRVLSKRGYERQSQINFNKSLKKVDVKSNKKDSLLFTLSRDKKELHIHYTKPMVDSTSIYIHGIDSLDQIIDTVLYVQKKLLPLPKEDFSVTLFSSSYNIDNQELIFIIHHNKPIKKWVKSNCSILIDSIESKAVKNITFDTLHQCITLSSPLIFHQDSSYSINMKWNKHSFISFENDSSQEISTSLKILPKDQSGSLIVHVETNEPSYTLQLVLDKRVLDEVHNTKNHTFINLRPKTYQLRLHIDSNQDKDWTPGNFFTKKPAERIHTYLSKSKSNKIPIRANWEYGPIVISNTQFTHKEKTEQKK